MTGVPKGSQGPVDVPEAAASLGIVQFAAAASGADVRLNGQRDGFSLAVLVGLLKISARVAEAITDRGGAALVLLEDGYLQVRLTISRCRAEIHHFARRVWAEAIGLVGVKGGQGHWDEQGLEGNERHSLASAATRRTTGMGGAGLRSAAVGNGHVQRLRSPLRGRVKPLGALPGKRNLQNRRLDQDALLPMPPWLVTAVPAPGVERSAPELF